MAFKLANGPKINIFFIERKGLCIPLDVLLEELDKRRQFSQKKLNIIKEQKKVLEKLIRNNRYNIIRTGLFGLMMLASLGAIMSSNQQTKKIGSGIFWGSALTNIAVGTVLHQREKKLEKQDAYWLKKERELERS